MKWDLGMSWPCLRVNGTKLGKLTMVEVKVVAVALVHAQKTFC